jgi:hypothetical protein
LIAALRPLRKVVLLLGALGMAAAVLVVMRDPNGPGTAGPLGSGTDRQPAAPVDDGPANPDGAGRSDLRGALEDQTDLAPSSGAAKTSTGSPGAGRVLVVGQLTGMHLIALQPDVALRETRSTPKRGITTYGRSDPVGAAISVLPIGTELLVLATDHKQLVRLHADWRTRRVLDLAPALGAAGRGALSFGPILRTSEREVVIPVAFDSSIGLLAVDVVEWRVTRAREFADRFAGFPGACISRGGIVMSSTNRIDRFSLATFERERSVPFETFARALACTEEAVWAADNNTPTGRVLDPMTLAETGRLGWRGSGARVLVPSGGRLLGTDPAAGIVFACDQHRHTCTESTKLAERANDIIEDGDVVYVTVEGPDGVAILDGNTLKTHGILPLPDLARTLTMLTI